MGNPPLGCSSLITDPQVLRRVRLVRLAAWVTVALAGVEAWLSFFPSSARCSIRPSTVWLLIVGMAAAPHVAVAWPGSPRKWQLALAYAWSWALTVLLWLSLFMTFDAYSLRSLDVLRFLFWGLFPLQLFIIATAAGVRTALRRAPRDMWVRVAGIAFALGWASLMASVLPANAHLLQGPPYSYTVSAVGSVRAVNTGLAAYQASCGGFAERLEQLGPPPGRTYATQPAPAAQLDCEHGGVIDRSDASGIRSGYRLTYAPGKRDAFNHILSYTLTARPEKYGETGLYSFFSDESAVIRTCCEDRAPTAQDPPLK